MRVLGSGVSLLVASLAACLAGEDDGATSEYPCFWTVSIRAKHEEGRAAAVIVFPHLNGRLPEGALPIRVRWKVSSAFESVFGVRKTEGHEIVANGRGHIEKPWVTYWRRGHSGRASVIRKLDEKHTLGYWERPGGRRYMAALRIPADKLSAADHFYTLDAALEIRAHDGKEVTLRSSERVRFLPSPGNESAIPDDMRDPTGILPDDEAAETLRDWLRFDDWYVQAVAVIRLKQLGRSLRASELARFFRLAALADRNSLGLIRRALDLLTVEEASEGVAKLLRAECQWALRDAIRWDVAGADAWLEERLARTFPGLTEACDYLSNDYKRRRFLSQLVTLKGREALPLLCRIARHCATMGQMAPQYDTTLKAICKLDPKKALELARERLPDERFRTHETLSILLRFGEEGDVLAACRRFEYYPEWNDVSRDLPERLPEDAVSVLIDKAAETPRWKRPLRRSIYRLLAASRTPAAKKACLAALDDEDLAPTIAKAFREDNRVEVVPDVVRVAIDRHAAGKDIRSLWPALLIDPPPQIHEIAAEAYAEGIAYALSVDVRKHLLAHPGKTAAVALRWCRSEKVQARHRAASLLLDLGDARAVPLLLERLGKLSPGPDTKPEAGSDPQKESRLTIDEMNYLAAFLPPGKLPGYAKVFVTYARSGGVYFERSSKWPPVRWLPTALERIRAYIREVQSAPRGWSAPSPVPSPVRILRLRGLEPHHVLPLARSADAKVRALAAMLLGRPTSGRLADDPVVPLLERLLFDESGSVRSTALESLQARHQCRAWHCERLLTCKPAGGDYFAAAAAAVQPHLSGNQERLRERVLGLLIEGDRAGLEALELRLPQESEVLPEALSSPNMTPVLARDIVNHLKQRPGDATFSVVHEALKEPMRADVRATVVRNIADFVGDRRFSDVSVRTGSPLARQAILDALRSHERGVRHAALTALTKMRIPGATPLLVAMLEAPPVGSDTATIASAAARQGDLLFLAPIEALLRKMADKRHIGSELSAYVTIGGEKTLPFLRQLEAGLRGRKGGTLSRQTYGQVIECLIRLRDPDTLQQQAAWFLLPDRYPSSDLRVGDRLKELIAAELVKQSENLRGKELAEHARRICHYAPQQGIEALIRLLRSDDSYAAKHARSILQRVVGYGFGGVADGNQYASRKLPQCAHNAERWWRLESGRSLEALRNERLFP